MRVFVSHSTTHDRSLALSVAQRLRAEGFTSTFLSADIVDGIDPGKEWEREIYAVVERAQAPRPAE